MKILFGIQGTGNGHISRGRMMARHFAEHNADVTYLFSGRPKQALFDMEIFGDFLYRRGLTFATRNGNIDYLGTARNNGIAEFLRDIRTLPVEDYDLVITDFEPVTAWAARLKKIPTLGIGHQYAFGANTPVTGDNVISRMLMRYFAPAEREVGLHWHPFRKNILPPIIDTGLRKIPADGHILVYLPFENQRYVTTLLNSFTDLHFIQYSPELSDSEAGNVSLRKTCLQGFKHDLAASNGVICNSGFELISECLHLGLPVLTKPINGQFEQMSNAKALRQLDYAETCRLLDRPVIEKWIRHRHAKPLKHFPDVAAILVKWILEKQSDIDPLSDHLWLQTR